MADRAPTQETLVIFPFMAQGHIIPFLALALQLEQRYGYRIVFVNTALNIQKLRSSLPTDSSISLKALPFCSTDHGLPPGSENTNNLPYPLVIRLHEASACLKPAFDQLVLDLTKQEGRPPLCIIADMFFGWSVDIAKELNIFHSVFITGCAYGMGVYSSLWLNLPHCKTDSDEVTLPDFPEVSSIHRSQLPKNLQRANSTDSWTIFLHKYLPMWFQSDGIMINTVEEFDQTGLKYFRRKTGGRPVWPILPAFGYQKNGGSVYCIRPQNKTGADLENCIEWLDTNPKNSVLFVSFGSQNTISSSQMMELATGLEASGRKFIWVIRPPAEFDINEEFRSEWLPKGYEATIKEQNKGLIVRKWAPQVEILSHESTCAFLSHCGWNSVLESLSHGVPILGWPLSADQTYNSKFLEEEVGVSIEVGRGNATETKHESIERAIQLVMGESRRGVEMRSRACEVREMIKNAIRDDKGFKGSFVNVIDDFINAALPMRK